VIVVRGWRTIHAAVLIAGIACNGATDTATPVPVERPAFRIDLADTLQSGEIARFTIQAVGALPSDSFDLRSDTGIAMCTVGPQGPQCFAKSPGSTQLTVVSRRDTTVRTSKRVTVIQGVPVRGVFSPSTWEYRFGTTGATPRFDLVYLTFYSAKGLPINGPAIRWVVGDSTIVRVEPFIPPSVGVRLQPGRAGRTEVVARFGDVAVTLPVSVFATSHDSIVVFSSAPPLLSVLRNDTPGLRIARVSAPAHGTARVVGDTAIAYTPDVGYAGADSVWYSVAGSPLGADSARVLLGVAPGALDMKGTPIIATGLNDAGEVSGYVIRSDGVTRAVRWNSETGRTDTLGGPGTRGWAINSRGDVAGDSSASGVTRAILWPVSGSSMDLGARDSSEPVRALSDTRRVLFNTLVWENGQDIPVIPRTAADFIHAMNARGELLLEHLSIVGVPMSAKSSLLLEPRLTPIPVPVAGWSSGQALSDNTWVAGLGEVAHGDVRVFLWSPQVGLTFVTPLAFGPPIGLPRRLNNSGWMITQGGGIHFVANRASFPIGSLQSDPSWIVSSVIAMNNRGQILAVAGHRSTSAFVVFTPRR
jgi:hypothetical protein